MPGPSLVVVDRQFSLTPGDQPSRLSERPERLSIRVASRMLSHLGRGAHVTRLRLIFFRVSCLVCYQFSVVCFLSKGLHASGKCVPFALKEDEDRHGLFAQGVVPPKRLMSVVPHALCQESKRRGLSVSWSCVTGHAVAAPVLHSWPSNALLLFA